MTQTDITLKKLDAQKSMMAAFGTKAHAVWQHIVREYEGKEKATAETVTPSKDFDLDWNFTG
jgi:hypothetical protein